MEHQVSNSVDVYPGLPSTWKDLKVRTMMVRSPASMVQLQLERLGQSAGQLGETTRPVRAVKCAPHPEGLFRGKAGRLALLHSCIHTSSQPHIRTDRHVHMHDYVHTVPACMRHTCATHKYTYTHTHKHMMILVLNRTTITTFNEYLQRLISQTAKNPNNGHFKHLCITTHRSISYCFNYVADTVDNIYHKL